MDTILEQNAIDQMSTMQQAARDRDEAQAPAYNFGRAGRIGSEQMRVLSVVARGGRLGDALDGHSGLQLLDTAPPLEEQNA